PRPAPFSSAACLVIRIPLRPLSHEQVAIEAEEGVLAEAGEVLLPGGGLSLADQTVAHDVGGDEPAHAGAERVAIRADVEDRDDRRLPRLEAGGPQQPWQPPRQVGI